MGFFVGNWHHDTTIIVCCAIGAFVAYLLDSKLEFPAVVRHEAIPSPVFRVLNKLAMAVNVAYFMFVLVFFSCASYIIYAVSAL